MIPTSYLFRDIYNDRWGDPMNPHAVDIPQVEEAPRHRLLHAIAGLFRRRRPRPDAWSFTIPAQAETSLQSPKCAPAGMAGRRAPY